MQLHLLDTYFKFGVMTEIGTSDYMERMRVVEPTGKSGKQLLEDAPLSLVLSPSRGVVII